MLVIWWETLDHPCIIRYQVGWPWVLTLTLHPTSINLRLLHQLDTSILDVVPLGTLQRCSEVLKIWSRGCNKLKNYSPYKKRWLTNHNTVFWSSTTITKIISWFSVLGILLRVMWWCSSGEVDKLIEISSIWPNQLTMGFHVHSRFAHKTDESLRGFKPPWDYLW